MSEIIQNNPERKEKLRTIIKSLKSLDDAAVARKEFKTFLRSVSAEEIASIEQSLIEEGIPVSEVQSLCEVHVELYEKSLLASGNAAFIAGHPVETYKRENKELKKRLGPWKKAALSLMKKTGSSRGSAALAGFLNLHDDLCKMELHYSRKENQLFPYLESVGFTGPSKVMWGKHDEIRALWNQARLQSERGDQTLKATILRTASLMSKMVFMEEKILFPTALRKLPEAVWAKIRAGENSIGYSWITPSNLYDPSVIRTSASAALAVNPDIQKVTIKGTDIPLDTGALPPEALNLMLTNLPLDVSYVDENDVVLYYSEGKHRVFPRSPGIIGRKVQNCHPPKSVDTVQKILTSFREKRKSEASFWLNMAGRFILIQYFALYDKAGNYKGVIEVSQDATWIRSLEGECRLLGWEE